MKLRTLLATTIAALGLAAAMPTYATTFAQFDQDGAGTFTFTNNSTKSTNLELTADIPVAFEYLVPNGTGIEAPTTIKATLVMTAIAAPAQTIGSTVIESYTSVSMVFTADTPIHGFSNLLTLTPATTGNFVSETNSSDATMQASTSGGDTVVFTSDFLNFAGGANLGYALSFSNLNPLLKIATTTAGHQTKKYPVTFSANGTGTFNSQPPPTFGTPEPSPVLALLVGAIGLVLLSVRNRKPACHPSNA